VKKILISLMTITLVCALIGGAVYATFSDTESTNNSFAVGTLDLTVNTENPWTTVPVSVSGMEPGANGSVSMTVTNSGTLDGSSLTVDLQNLVDDAGTTPEPEPTPDYGELSANIDIVLWEDNGAGSGGVANDGVQNGTEATLYSGKLNAEAGAYTVGSGLAHGATNYVGFSYSIASGVGDVIQGDSCTFDIVFVLSQ